MPFGSLGKITNYSRDWVIDKVTLGLTYDTDLDQVKRIIKQIGKELLADPELGPQIIDTLKMQGVEEYSDFAIKIRLKMTCKPGEQFVVRRRAYALIKKAFEENGIKFAFPTVQVAGGAGAQARRRRRLLSTQSANRQHNSLSGQELSARHFAVRLRPGGYWRRPRVHSARWARMRSS